MTESARIDNLISSISPIDGHEESPLYLAADKADYALLAWQKISAAHRLLEGLDAYGDDLDGSMRDMLMAIHERAAWALLQVAKNTGRE